MIANQKQIIAGILLSGMSLGTAWAIRGSFGHEHGAAWAGAIGALSVILLSKNEGWYALFLKATLASAVGWGIGGIMSYGLVVGYGAGVDFGNVYYGFTMLLVIGGLQGFIGGGLFGLVLSDQDHAKVKWHKLMVEMICGGILFYYLLINAFEWLMTPPRSEEWAVCLGMAFALTWFLFRNHHYQAIRVAVFSALGAGFGFAFGNFLQVMGRSASFDFINLWNVMEYSIGFFGGCGMAYGTFTSRWDLPVTAVRKPIVLLPLLMITLIIPFIVWDQTFSMEQLRHANVNEEISGYIQLSAIVLVLVFFGYWLKTCYWNFRGPSKAYDYRQVYIFFIGHFTLYTLFHFLDSAAFIHGLSLQQYLYLLNLAVIFFFIKKIHPDFSDRGLNGGKWAGLLVVALAVLAVLALIAIHSHGAFPNMHKRFS